jgi:hypothetical protein
MSRSSEYPKLMQIIIQYMVRDMSVCPRGTPGWVGVNDGYFSRLIIAHPILNRTPNKIYFVETAAKLFSPRHRRC